MGKIVCIIFVYSFYHFNSIFFYLTEVYSSVFSRVSLFFFLNMQGTVCASVLIL